MDWPNLPSVGPTHISTYSINSGVATALKQHGSGAAQPAVVTWVSNLAIYVPVIIEQQYIVRRVWWINGSTITSTNADFGIYTPGGTALYRTGSTAMSGASTPQYVSLGGTPLRLDAGLYYFGWSCNNTTSRGFGGVPAAGNLRMSGVLQQTSAFALPATMTPAAVSNSLVPYCGITRTASGF